MSTTDTNTGHEAVNRLFELAQCGDMDNLEFSQLDSLIYEGLEQTYSAEVIPVSTLQARAAA